MRKNWVCAVRAAETMGTQSERPAVFHHGTNDSQRISANAPPPSDTTHLRKSSDGG